MIFKIEILTPLIPFFLGIILKTILDLNLAIKMVKWLSKIPHRSILRIKPPKISGIWKQTWFNNDSSNYAEEVTSDLKIYQFGKFIYGEFQIGNKENYYIWGEIIHRSIIGKWQNKTSDLGYYGAFEGRIIDEKKIEGVWLGHSHSNPNKINSGNWKWHKD